MGRSGYLAFVFLVTVALSGAFVQTGYAQEDRAVDEDALSTLAPEDDPDEPLAGFYDTADLSLVITGGNSSSTSFGFRNLAEYYWPSSSLRFDAGGLSTTARSREDRVAVGTGEGDFEVVDGDRQKTAENFFANLRFDKDLSERWFAFAIAGWNRNTFAGFDNRWQGALGLGWIAVDTDRTTLRFDLAGTYTSEDPIVGPVNDFAGLRFGYDYIQRLGENSNFYSTLILDENLKNTDDLRADWYNAIEVSITDLIFLKTSFRVQWRNDPLFEELPLFDSNGDPVLTPGGDQVSVPAQLDPVDTYFLTSLVLKI
jgi:putative salt-induced outer membrane protein YdiY